MTLLLRYWKPLAVLVLLGLVYLWGRVDGHKSAELDCQRQRNADYAANQEFVDKLNQDLQEALKRRQAPQVKEVIRANPSGCVVPGPVADGMRQAIRASNAE